MISSSGYILIEPIPHRELIDFVASAKGVVFIEGVTSCSPAGEIDLLLAGDSLGNSIIPSKPGLSGLSMKTFNHHFPDLYRYLIGSYLDSGVCDEVMIRMNAEGVEGPIIDFLATLEEKVKANHDS
jgi:hypothetical protein